MRGPRGTKEEYWNRARGMVDSIYIQYKETLPKPKAAGKPKATGAPQPPPNQMNQMDATHQNWSYFNPFHPLLMMGMMNIAQQQQRMPQFLATQVVFVAWAVAQGWAVAQSHMKPSCFAPRCPPRPKNEGKWSPQKVKAKTNI